MRPETTPKRSKAAPQRPKPYALHLRHLEAATTIGAGKPQRPKRYRGAETGTFVGVRLQPALVARLDRYRGGATRPEAIRRLIEEGLS